MSSLIAENGRQLQRYDEKEFQLVVRVIPVPSNHIRSSFNSTSLQGGQLNGLLIAGTPIDMGTPSHVNNNNIACEYDAFIQLPTPAAHGGDDDYERAAAASSSPNQQLVGEEINDNNEHLNDHESIIDSNTTSVLTPGVISSMFEEKDIGKTVLGYVPSALVALLINIAAFPGIASHVVLIVFSVGVVLIWNGMMLGNTFPRSGRAAEKAGVVMVFLGFFGLVASVLPLALVWAPLLCGVLFLLPFILRVLPASHSNLLLGTNNSRRIGANSRHQLPLLPMNNLASC